MLLKLASRLAKFTVVNLIALTIALVCLLNAHARSQDRTIVGYYISWRAYGHNYRPRDIDPTKFTHIIYSFADIDNGVITLSNASADPPKNRFNNPRSARRSARARCRTGR